MRRRHQHTASVAQDGDEYDSDLSTAELRDALVAAKEGVQPLGAGDDSDDDDQGFAYSRYRTSTRRALTQAVDEEDEEGAVVGPHTPLLTPTGDLSPSADLTRVIESARARGARLAADTTTQSALPPAPLMSQSSAAGATPSAAAGDAQTAAQHREALMQLISAEYVTPAARSRMSTRHTVVE